jgi:serine/threonine protein kinase/Flp pilus assembly protein TadD
MENNSSAKEIFFAALEQRSPQDLASYLKQACGNDAELRQQVEQLLRAHDQAGRFLGGPETAAPTIDGAVTFAPSQIGPYKLLQQIGEGGMGVVYLAEQTASVHRQVALKIIKPGMDSRQVIARFEAERQALALMDHVNIARVLDAGATENGRPYFVMELVHGVPITKYCDDNRLNPRQRLELFIPVCQAIQHAHQKGIIHRDIKPSNVMVTLYDGQPVPKVIDFGVAKATEQKLTERTLFTQFGTMIGTLEYMSPEQAEMSALGVDTRSDIYSLGVLLYELLTGSTPISASRQKSAAYAEILRLIKEEEPPRPSTRLSESGEALASISAQRHMEPQQLTRMMRGELDWIVMKSLEKDRNRRYESALGFAQDIQRHLSDEPVQACPPSRSYRFRKFARRNKAALATAALIGLATLVAVGSLAGSIGWIASESAAQVARTAAKAKQALEQAKRLQAQAKWREARVEVKNAQALLASSTADSDQAMQATELLKDLKMAAELESVRLARAAFKGQGFDYVQSDLDYTRVFREYGIPVGTLDARTAAELIEKRAIRPEIVAALDDWVLVRKTSRKLDHLNWKHLLAVASEADPDEFRNRLRDALESHDETVLQETAASEKAVSLSESTLVLLSGTLVAQGLRDEALSLLRRAQQKYPADFWINHELAGLLGSAEKWDGAIRYATGALAVRPQSPGTYMMLGRALAKTNAFDEAEAAYRKAVELEPEYASAHIGVGWVLHERGNLVGAEAAYRTAARLEPGLAMAHYNVGNVLRDQHRLSEAITELSKATEIQPRFADAWDSMGLALKEQGKLLDAEKAHRKAIETHADDVGAYRAYANLGAALGRQGRQPEAVESFRTAIKLQPNQAQAYYGLGLALGEQGQKREAIPYFRKAVDLNPKYFEAYGNLGFALKSEGEFKEAVSALKQSRDLLPPEHPGRQSMQRLIQSCERQIELESKLPAILTGDAQPASAAERVEYAAIATAKKRFTSAARLYEEAFAAEPDLATDVFSYRRFDAAGTAARVGNPQDLDRPRPTEEERTRWREKAMEWLQADLKVLEQEGKSPSARARKWLLLLQRTPEFSALREEAEIERFPDAEQLNYRKFWDEVRAFLGN